MSIKVHRHAFLHILRLQTCIEHIKPKKRLVLKQDVVLSAQQRILKCLEKLLNSIVFVVFFQG